MGRGKFEGFGMSEKQIRKMQAEVSDKVDKNKAEIAAELEQKKKDREFRELSETSGMNKADLGRANRARK